MLGIDVGGTFTDLVFADGAGRIFTAKTPTTAPNPVPGILTGIRELLDHHRLAREQLTTVVHGTTLVANALIERKGAPTGLITTRGFRDVLEIGRETRYDIYDLHLRRPEPLVPRWRRQTVPERIDAQGEVLEVVDHAEVERVGRDLVAGGARAIAVCLLHAYANPKHEREIQAQLERLFPELHVSVSSTVAPEIREYERTATTVANAYVQPLMAGYLAELERELTRLSARTRLYVMLSSGGVTSAAAAAAVPVRLVESGPAGGVTAAAYVGRQCGQSGVVAFDMGGTTAKVCLIEGGRPRVTHELEVARLHRLKRGSGLPLKTASIDVVEIGAGGGSIAHLGSLGLLQVGPESAGARPGPACYAFGRAPAERAEPTVTDADLVLGYLDPDYFLGGAMRLRRDLAERAIAQKIAQPLGISVVEAAAGIRASIDDHMARAVRVHAAERGRDIRNDALVAFGGAGPVHAHGIARQLHLRRVLCPARAGILSALGFILAPLAVDDARSYLARLDAIDWTRLNGLFAEMEESGRALLTTGGVDSRAIRVERLAEMRYAGQTHEITVALPVRAYTATDALALLRRFQAGYRRLFGHALADVPVETLNWRSRVWAPSQLAAADLQLARPARTETAARARTDSALPTTPNQTAPALPDTPPKGRRRAYFAEAGGFVECPVFDRYALAPGAEIVGPALIEERESTFVLGPGMRGTVDQWQNVMAELES
ncbi:MAG: hydantoinase/oxoprolinase family protein [Chloroflexi bacterium]|nr:hydantoinase/oxoprolinase family protein [Chloroflexota bacterium]